MTLHLRPTQLLPPDGRAARACAYLRVSTGRQAEADLSIPDQRRQIATYCATKGWNLVAEYVEPGASATDDNRPEFQRLIERATDDDKPFDVIVVQLFEILSRLIRTRILYPTPR